MKGLRIGKRRGREPEAALSPLELALRPALVDGRWQVPDRFNFTRDVIEALARDPKRRALTFLGSDGIIEPRTFRDIAEGATVWALALRERGIAPGDRVVLMAGSTVDWLECLLGIWKVGGVLVPCVPTTTPSQLERLVSSTDAALVVAERALEPNVERMGFTPEVHFYDDAVKRNSKEIPTDVPTHDTTSRDLAFVVSTTGVGGARKDVAHTHGSAFATRVQAEHWLDVGRGDTVWCTAESSSPLTMWNTVVGPWSRGAEIALQHGEFEVDERLDLLFRLGPSILCQSPAEYRALAEHPKLERFRSPRLRRLVSTGDVLDPEVAAVFEERWGLPIADGYGQAETNILVGNLGDGPVQPGSIGRALPGHHVGVIDDQGNELPVGIEGDLAVRGRPPTLFAGYWELPEETKSAFLGDWYLTGDVARMDEEGGFTFVGRAEDVITSSGRTFGPSDVERVLDGHAAIAATAVVGIRDLQRGGQFVRAFVVPRSPDGGSEQLEAELRQYVAQTLPNQQVPREIVFVDELPRVGWKISRHELRERPLAGRPLWEMPPTTEPDADVKPAPPPFDAEFSPRIESQPTAEAAPLVREADPPAAPPIPVAAPKPEPMPAPAPAPQATPEPSVAPVPQAVEPVRVPEPAPVEPPESEPVVAEAAPAPEPEPDLPEPEVAVVPEPEPQVAEPAVAPEPEPEPEPQVVEPEPQVAEAAAVEPEPEPEIEVEVEVDETPTPVEVDADPPVSAAVEIEAPSAPEQAGVEPEVEPEPAPELRITEPPASEEPVEEPASEEPVAAVTPEPAPEPEPVKLEEEPPEPAPTPPPVGELVVVDREPEPLPDYVVERPNGVPPVVVPEPEPEPDLSGPAPEYVVERSEDELARFEPPPAEPEEEEDLGPLPEYVIDPNDPEAAARRHVPPPPPEPEPVLTPRPSEPVEEPAPAPALSFPSAAELSIPHRAYGDTEPKEPRAPRPRLQADAPSGNRPPAAADPGDEGEEVSWMEGLSSRLNAYSLSEEDEKRSSETDGSTD